MNTKGNTAIPSGVVLIDKPSGMTSHDVISRLRRLTGYKKIGHAGTLDPLATGLLLVLFGSATRLSSILTGHNKTYEAVIRFGETTDTDDSDGEVLETFPVDPSIFDTDFATSTLRNLIGVHQQIPPQYSSLKVNGQRGYELARKGIDVNLESRPIEIIDAQLLECADAQKSWRVRLKVSKGTYIRSIARDLGAELGCGAHITALRRLETFDDRFLVEDAWSLENIESLYLDGGRISDAFCPIEDLGFDHHINLVGSDFDVACGRYQFMVRPESTLPDIEKIPLWSLDKRLLGFGSYNSLDGSRQLSEERNLFRVKPDTVFPGGIGSRRFERGVATIGVFDGVHSGHQLLLNETVRLAREKACSAYAFTFDPSPKEFFKRETAKMPLCSLKDRIELIKSYGIDHVFILPFNEELSQLSGEEFIDNVLLNKARLSALVVGEDFRFGSNAQDSVFTVESYCASHGIELKTLNLVCDDDQRVSSTKIREMLEQGSIAVARRLLGHGIEFGGYVAEGARLGRTLGFPTANIVPEIGLHLGDGVYSARVMVNQKNYKAGLFVGKPRDVNQPKTFEVHLLECDENLYGKEVRVEVLDKVNDVQRFDTFDALKTGVAHNVLLVEQYFSHTIL